MSPPSAQRLWRGTTRGQVYIWELQEFCEQLLFGSLSELVFSSRVPLSHRPSQALHHYITLVSYWCRSLTAISSTTLLFFAFNDPLWVIRSWLYVREHFVSFGITKECKWAVSLCTSPPVSVLHRGPAWHVLLASPASSPSPSRMSFKLIGAASVFTWKPGPLFFHPLTLPSWSARLNFSSSTSTLK